MTNPEMIKWAGLEEASDTIWHANKENLDRLIWVAKNQARQKEWERIAGAAKVQYDVHALSSYPSLK